MAVNADDPWGRRLLELCPTALSFGLQKGALNKRHLWGELLSAGTEGCHMRMLHEQGYAVFLGGNIGTPLSEYVLGSKKADVLVLEISSFQLQAWRISDSRSRRI